MWYFVAKRTIDILGSIILLIIFSPVIIVSAIIIKSTSKGPIFADTPPRVGQNGKPFYAYKFRTMIVNAYELLKTDPKFKKALKEQQEAGNYKIKDDPRITNVGRVLRRHSIDEVPQLVNVLRGEMSIVGPRPYYEEELALQQEKYPGTEKYVKQMLKVKPGITGYWQVTGRSEVDFEQRIKMDAYYAQKKSLFLDILILLKTPIVMISGKGAL
ncbi:MAG: sugar transferase [Candidatus Absconditabacterales bacterium]|nr:sugar transferase [Candidatus Absconditabacterales bacterium]